MPLAITGVRCEADILYLHLQDTAAPARVREWAIDGKAIATARYPALLLVEELRIAMTEAEHVD